MFWPSLPSIMPAATTVLAVGSPSSFASASARELTDSQIIVGDREILTRIRAADKFFAKKSNDRVTVFRRQQRRLRKH